MKAVARRNGRKRRQQVRAVQALVDKLKREQAIAAATHAYPALSCPVRHVLVNLINIHKMLRLKASSTPFR